LDRGSLQQHQFFRQPRGQRFPRQVHPLERRHPLQPGAPDSSRITATVETGSAADGVPLHEETLPQPEWFNVAKYPSAAFKSTRVLADGAIEGTVTIKGRQLPVTGLKATVDQGILHIAGKFDIARKDADLGQQSDASGDYVSLKIGVDVNVTA
jgi:polyisoprenoid-binding protein YceI